MTSGQPTPPTESLLAQFRAGRDQAAHQLLERYRPWLRLLAQVEMQSQLRAKFDPSDVVQQAMLGAFQDLPRFRGRTEREWRAWLRQVLAHVLAHELRKYAGTKKRDISLEQPLEQRLSETTTRLVEVAASADPSPTRRVMDQERDLVLARVLEEMPEDYREVIVLRHFEGLTHEEIAVRMGRRPGAVRMLWIRALGRLREQAELLARL